MLYAEIMLLRADWAAKSNSGTLDEDISTGLAAIDKVFAMKARMAQALAIQGNLLVLKSRRSRDEKQKAQTVRQATDALEAALRSNPLLDREYGAVLADARRLRR